MAHSMTWFYNFGVGDSRSACVEFWKEEGLCAIKATFLRSFQKRHNGGEKITGLNFAIMAAAIRLKPGDKWI